MPKHPSAEPSYFWKGQVLHAVSLIVLIGLTVLLTGGRPTEDRQLFGVSAQAWLITAILVPILHQIYVWIAWRSELCFGSLAGMFGSQAFKFYKIGFFLLFLARPIPIILLAIADHDSLAISIPTRIILCTLLGLPALYTGYSVVRYFGVARASGADHFDPSYRERPMVNEGIYKYTNNAMYSYAFLSLWIIGIAGASWLALVAAAFNHAYIWVHYFCTERPDMSLIYQRAEASATKP